VDVAAGGLCEDEGEPRRAGADCAAETGVALRREEVVRKRVCCGRAFEAARRQLRQIMLSFVGWRVNSSSSPSLSCGLSKLWLEHAGAAELFLRPDGR
jgi:hypothetical protein